MLEQIVDKFVNKMLDNKENNTVTTGLENLMKKMNRELLQNKSKDELLNEVINLKQKLLKYSSIIMTFITCGGMYE